MPIEVVRIRGFLRNARKGAIQDYAARVESVSIWTSASSTVLAMNPAREVKTERFSRTEGKTPAFVEGEVQKLLGVMSDAKLFANRSALFANDAESATIACSLL
jgi:hypothetical protein